jgi:hypothetical protein
MRGYVPCGEVNESGAELAQRPYFEKDEKCPILNRAGLIGGL